MTLIKSVQLVNDELHIDVVGVPFGGPDYLGGRDLDMEKFDKSTDIGGLPVVFSYFDHAKEPNFGREKIGYAYLQGQDEDGWLYRIIVDRHHKYKKLLKRLADERLLSASSSPHQNSAEKSADNTWKRWHVVEVSLTPTPANPLATQIMQKALSGELDMADETQSTQQETPAQDAQESTSLAQQIEKAFETPAPAQDTPAQEVGLGELLKSISDRLTNIEAQLTAHGTAIGGAQQTINDIKTALPVLSQQIAKSLKATVTEDLSKSASERQAESQARQTVTRSVYNKLPSNAPGNH